MRVLLTGASGFLGSHIAQALSDSGHEVRALVRKTSRTSFLRSLANVTLCEGAVEDRSSCVEATKDVQAVIHSAGLVKARTRAEFQLVNVIGTQNVLEATLSAPIPAKRFVFVSSLAARAPSPDGRPLAPNAEPCPVTDYGRSKLEAERLVLGAKERIHVTVVRPTGIYGPRDREMFQLFQYAARRVLPYIGDPEGKLTLIHGADCARAVVLCLTAGIESGRSYDLDDGSVYTRAELAEGLEAAIEKRAWLRFPIPTPVVKAVGLLSETYGRIADRPVMLGRQKVEELLQQWVGDSGLARKELSFEPQIRWRDGARSTARWYRDHGWL